MYRTLLDLLPAPVLLLVSTAPCEAQVFTESFDDLGDDGPGGPSALVDAGWSFPNRSAPALAATWGSPPSVVSPYWAAHGGPADGWILCQQRDVVVDQGAGSVWMVLPEIPLQQAGDRLRFRLRAYPNGQDRLQVRYSPAGGSATGSGPSDVGDFTDLLWEEDARTGSWNRPMDDRWYLQEVDLPGDGRLAFRYTTPYAEPLGSGSKWGIDELEVARDALEPPYPDSGETVHWTLEDSPAIVPDDREIVAGGTVVVDPGVVVRMQDGARLTVHGAFLVEGAQRAPVLVEGDAGNRVDGLGVKRFAWSRLQVGVVNSSTFLACSFEPGSSVGWLGATDVQRPTLYHLEQCSFVGGALHTAGQTVARNVSIDGVDARIDGFALLEDVHVDGAMLHLAGGEAQDALVDRVTVLNNGAGPGLRLEGRDYLIGPNTVLAGNDVPIDFGPALGGLLPGSSVPTVGNTNDHVRDALATDPREEYRWAKLDVPYVVHGYGNRNRLRLDPGVRVLFRPGAGWNTVDAPLVALGTPDEPIVFERFDPAQPWQGLVAFGRLDHCVLDGATTNSGRGVAWLNDCIVRDCVIGMNEPQANALVARKTQFLGNDTAIRTQELIGVALLDFAGLPNAFEGNGVAVHLDSFADVPAEGNWWGDRRGPDSPDNNGHGDLVLDTGPGEIDTVPFLAERPDFDDHPPVVRLRPLSDVLFPGTDVVLMWESEDDGAVVSQRIELAEFTDAPEDFEPVATGLGPDAGAFAWRVPRRALAQPLHVRVVAVDDAGQEGYDEHSLHVPQYGVDGPSVTFQADLSGPFEMDERLPVCFTHTGSGGYPDEAFLLLEGDRDLVRLGATSGGCLVLDAPLPHYSTDLARIALVDAGGSGNWYFSEPFEIRPNVAVGDAPPTVTLVTPHPGRAYAAPGTVHVSWIASDDVGMRSFDLQVSYDGGRFWNLLAENLPADTASHDWDLPAIGRPISDVRVRVVARDTRFQNSSDGSDRSFRIVTRASDPE